MWRLGLGLTIAVCGALALSVAAIWSRPVEGGDATTDRAEDAADESSPPRRFTPVPLDIPTDEGPRAPRISSDPALDTGAPARSDEGLM